MTYRNLITLRAVYAQVTSKGAQFCSGFEPGTRYSGSTTGVSWLGHFITTCFWNLKGASSKQDFARKFFCLRITSGSDFNGDSLARRVSNPGRHFGRRAADHRRTGTPRPGLETAAGPSGLSHPGPGLSVAWPSTVGSLEFFFIDSRFTGILF